jgi:hypothetical protein
MKKLYKFEQDFFYGKISGIFLADPEEMELFFSESRNVALGDALGKHSEVYLDLSMGDFTELPSGSLTEEEMKLFEIGVHALDQVKGDITGEILYGGHGDLEGALEHLDCLELLPYFLETTL